jgi:hypothetical protein
VPGFEGGKILLRRSLGGVIVPVGVGSAVEVQIEPAHVDKSGEVIGSSRYLEHGDLAVAVREVAAGFVDA